MMKLFLTGATGFLGGELLVELAKRKDVDTIYCLVRAQSDEAALMRLTKVFNLHNDIFDPEKVIPVVGELTDPHLATLLTNHHQLRTVNTIIHAAANTSFSKIYDDSVEKVNIGGTHQLLKWAQTLEALDTFTYVGTATICGSTVKECLVTEDLSPDLTAKHLVKYSYTKMIGELILKDYLPEDKILVVRPSIIMGDSRSWAPRSCVILWALATFNQLRMFPMSPNSHIDIIPIDYAVRCIVELLFNPQRKYSVYHISSGRDSVTTPQQLITAIKDAFPGMPDFRFVSKSLWPSMKKWTKNGMVVDHHNPLYEYRNYLEYWIDHFGDNTKLRILFHALEPYMNFIELGQIFDNSRLLEDTHLEPSVPAHVYVTNSTQHIDSINIFEGAIDY
jgi:thioester reductase-like protein